jgi:serine/threonine protein kinase
MATVGPSPKYPMRAVSGALKPGATIAGKKSEYKIVEQLGNGFSGVTYKAENIKDGEKVVIKMPLFDPGQPYAQIIRDATEIQRKFLQEWTAMQALIGLNCAAQIRDYELKSTDLGLGVDVPVLFMVQRYVDGKPLDKEMVQSFPQSGTGKFNGISDGEEYLQWALKISRSLSAIHQRQVVHGDIHQENIMINPQGEAVFIDFGQAILRDVSCPGVGGSFESGIRIVPEEDGSGTIAGDIYSLGGVLYFLATGESLPRITKEYEDLDPLKDMIVERIRSLNEKLYASNAGVTDVIARCVRYHQVDRIPNTDFVIRDLESFSIHFGNSESEEGGIRSPLDTLKAVEDRGNRLFCSIARHQITILTHSLENMAKGVCDISGDHETIVSGMKEYLACLREGDCYLTITLPSFWSRRNLGHNGRYLTMNILAAQRHAVIRRIFLVTKEDDIEETRKVFTMHLQAQDLVRKYNPEVQTSGSELEAGGFYTAFQMLEKGVLDEVKRGGKNNYGLLLPKGDLEDHGLLMVPVYRTDDVIVTIQFRSHPGVVRDFKKDFEKRLHQAMPLSQHPAMQRQ